MEEQNSRAGDVEGQGQPEQMTLREVLALLFSKRGPFGRLGRIRKGRLLDRYGRPLH